LERPHIYQVPLNTAGQVALERIKIVWQEGQEKLEFDEDLLDDAVLDFSARLVIHEEWKGGIGTIEYYCGIMGYQQKTSTWAKANNYTPKLAGIQWCMRIILLEWTLPTKDRNDFCHDAGETPLDKFRKVHGKWLVEGQATGFDYVHTLLNYGMKAAQLTRGKDHIFISSDKQVLYYDGDPLRILMWISCVHKMVEEFERLTCLLLHMSKLPEVDLYIKDNQNMRNIGKYFGTEQVGGKEGARERMLKRLEAKGEFDVWMDNTGGFKADTVLRYERLVQEWLRLCSVLIVFTCGMAGRGYEMLSVRYYNSRVSRRNILIEDGQIMIVTEYHKSMGITDDIKVSSHHLIVPDLIGDPEVLAI
jgi:hypothetical protein